MYVMCVCHFCVIGTRWVIFELYNFCTLCVQLFFLLLYSLHTVSLSLPPLSLSLSQPLFLMFTFISNLNALLFSLMWYNCINVVQSNICVNHSVAQHTHTLGSKSYVCVYM